jgi:hypothetical protein
MYKAQYAFNMSMIMCPAVHMATRSLLRSSSIHEPSDPLSRINFFIMFFFFKYFQHRIFFLNSIERDSCIPRRNPLVTNNIHIITYIAILVPRISF